jgi:hypothetical protein
MGALRASGVVFGASTGATGATGATAGVTILATREWNGG